MAELKTLLELATEDDGKTIDCENLVIVFKEHGCDTTEMEAYMESIREERRQEKERVAI